MLQIVNLFWLLSLPHTPLELPPTPNELKSINEPAKIGILITKQGVSTNVPEEGHYIVAVDLYCTRNIHTLFN